MLIRKAAADEMLRLWGFSDLDRAPNTAKFFYQNISDGNAIFYTADLNDILIGELYAYLDLNDKDFADGNETAYLCAFRVRKEYRCKGIGHLLMETALSDLKMKGFRYATIGVDDERNERLYRSFGFTMKIKDCFFDPCDIDDDMHPVYAQTGFQLLKKEL
ncbi:MAG: GNAT family N-acetyltransferase [Erysipelotrichaceae bacterium]|nr:GNAT family N-acetyltransferase [Erysipelotrichaceae bacterium]